MIRSLSITDARGIPVNLVCNPKRIVSLICSITETLFEIGLEDRIAGRTRYCVRPEQRVGAVPAVGGPKNPDIEHIVSLNPDLVIANVEENEKKDIAALENEGVPVFVTYPKTVADGISLITMLGLITGRETAAEALSLNVSRILAETLRAAESMTTRPAVAYLIWRNPYMSVNRDTFIHDMIMVCGGRNVFAGRNDRYPEISHDEIIEAQPDILVLPSEPYRFREKHVREFEKFPDIPAVRAGRVLLADGELFSWYGARMCCGLPYVYRLISRTH